MMLGVSKYAHQQVCPSPLLHSVRSSQIPFANGQQRPCRQHRCGRRRCTRAARLAVAASYKAGSASPDQVRHQRQGILASWQVNDRAQDCKSLFVVSAD